MTGDLQNKLRQLSENFAAQLPDRLVEINGLWAELTADNWQQESAEKLLYLCHKLAGGSGTFGFGRLGVFAGQIEAELDRLTSANTSPDNKQREVIGRLIGQLPVVAEISSQSSVKFPTQTRPITPLALRPIYVVDDDPDQREAIAAALIESGYEVVLCADLQQLEDKLLTLAPGAVIMDLGFPEGPMAGSDLISRMHEDQVLKVPVVFISIRNSVISRLRAVRAGGDAYFPKPIELGELVERLDYLVAKGKDAPYKVLIIDDDEALAEYHANILRSADLEVATLSRPLKVLEMMADFQPELLLLDLHMPECSGIELASLLRQHRSYENIPIVFLSAEEGVKKHFEARLVGADDFLVKPIDEQFLIAAVVNRVQRARSVEQRMSSDSMTDLLNHQALLDELERELALGQREGKPLAFCMFDLDHFKRVNDSYGHMVGDAVIKSFADLLKVRLRRSDVIGRYGGEEFAVGLPNTTVEQAREVAEGIRREFATLQHFCESEQFKVTVSGGIASSVDYPGLEALVEAADEALYRAKKGGRDRVE